MMGMGGQIELPWPPKELSPNARIHYLAKSRVTKGYREQAYWLAVAADCPAPREGPVVLSIVFHPPDRRKRDLDGMFSSIKAGLDGIADGILANDERFEFALKRAEPVKHGRVVITIGEGSERFAASVEGKAAQATAISGDNPIVHSADSGA